MGTKAKNADNPGDDFRQGWQQRVFITVLTLLAGIFLSFRAKGFLIQWRGMDLPLALPAAAAAALAAAVLIFGFPRSIGKYMLRGVGSIVVLAAALCVAYLGRGILCTRAIERTGITLGLFARSLYVVGSGAFLWFFLALTLPALGRALRAIWNMLKQFEAADYIFLAAVLLLANLFAWRYAVSSEAIYFWDNAIFWKKAMTMESLWRESGLMALLRDVYDSVLTNDYNDIIALPAMLFCRLFGGSRLSFLLSIANFGYFPFGAVLLCVCKTACKRYRLVAAAVLLAFPMLFYNVLVGIVDVIGCSFTLAAYGLVIWDRGRNRLDVFLLAGLCLAAAILLRRWYSFFAVSFVIMLILDCILFRRSAMPAIGTIAGLAAVLGYFFQPLISERMLANYRVLYAAYMLSLKKDFLLLFRYYGIILLVLLIASAVFLWREKRLRPAVVFLWGQMVLCFFLFVQVQTHGQQHLLLYAAPLCMLALLTADRLLSLRREKTAAAVLLAVSLVQMLSPLLPRYQPGSLDELKKPALLPSFSWSAPKNGNAEKYVAIVHRLDELGADGSTVGVAAASFELNANLLRNTLLSLSLPGGDEPRTYLKALPEVDSRDGWSDTVFRCDYLVVADPVQVHLGEENEQCIALPAHALLEQTGMGRAFVRTDDHWTLDSGADVYIYRRIRDITEEEKAEMREQYTAARAAH